MRPIKNVRSRRLQKNDMPASDSPAPVDDSARSRSSRQECVDKFSARPLLGHARDTALLMADQVPYTEESDAPCAPRLTAAMIPKVVSRIALRPPQRLRVPVAQLDRAPPS